MLNVRRYDPGRWISPVTIRNSWMPAKEKKICGTIIYIGSDLNSGFRVSEF